jgi:hypothetical protein
MSRRWLGMLGVVLALALVGGPVAAKDFTGGEEQRKTFPCPKKGEKVPENQSPPKKKDCRTKKQKTYKGTYYSNDVKCAKNGHDAQVAKLYTAGGPTDGGVGVCNDGDAAPIQGRVVFTGGSSGFTLYADGDKDNSPDQAQGYIRFDLTPTGGGFGCGSEDGKRDASRPQKDSDPSNCG